jgi:hypothetical protein
VRDHEREKAEDQEADDEAAARPAQSAALHTGDGEGQSAPQDGTDDTRWDTDQHSDAPGPTGTG